jgi:hypothetical protein
MYFITSFPKLVVGKSPLRGWVGLNFNFMSKTEKNPKKSAAHSDPPLIPTPVFNAENKPIKLSTPILVSSQMLDNFFPSNMKVEIAKAIQDLAALVEQARDRLTAQSGRRNNVVGKGFRNFGFKMAANQSINNFPELVPSFIDVDSFNDVVEDYLFVRDLAERTLAITTELRDMMNIFGNIGFDYALAYYANVQTIANRTGNQTAASVFNTLRQYFRRRRTPNSSSPDEPTQEELDLHIKAITDELKPKK